MSTESIQRAALYTGLNLAVSALYYFGVKDRYIPGAILNKQAAAIGLSLITQASREFLINHDNRNNKPTLQISLLIHVAAISILGIGTYLSGVPLRTAALATLVLGLTHAQIADYIIYKNDLATFPHPARSYIDEARQVLGLMKEGPLKESARIKIFLTEATFNVDVESVLKKHGNLYDSRPMEKVKLLCGLAEIGKSEDLIQAAYKTALTLDKDPYLQAACMIRVAYAAKKLTPHRSDFGEYLRYCQQRFKPSDVKEKEIKGWKAAFEKYNGADYIPKHISDPGQHHMTRCAYHIQNGNNEEARQATREDVWNLYWRVEALCEIAEQSV